MEARQRSIPAKVIAGFLLPIRCWPAGGGSADPSRRSYTFYTLQSHGLPYSRWWLEDRLRQNSAQFFAPAALFGGYDYSSGQEIAPQYELFGLDRPESVQRLTELALAGIQAIAPSGVLISTGSTAC
ncbi:hypothetical protein [Synechococcus sp. W55.2]|uniref:hypothetical protein n=1 Tax=Synechococcus sp. W55.2 TaxID=2964513 RepID=UPI0039C08D68